MVTLLGALRVLALALVCTGCGGNEEAIRVGAYLSLTGEDATFGTDTRSGIDLAVEEVNAAGGVRGKKIKVYYGDDKSLGNEAVQKVQQLIDRKHVVALLGEVASAKSKLGSLIAEQRKIPMITPSSTAVDVTEGRDYTFRTCFTDAQQGEVAARYLHDVAKKQNVAIFYVAQDLYSAGLAASFRDNFIKIGGKIVVEKGYQKKETNFATYLQEIKAANPDAIFVPNYYSDMVPIARQAKTIGIPGSMFMGGDGWDSAELLDAKDELEGAHFTNPYAPDVPWENSKAFIAAFRARYGAEPNSIAAQGYDAARLLFDAFGRAKSLDPTDVKDAIAETKNFQGATGVLTIDKGHNANKPVVIVEVRGGEFHYASELLAE